MTMPPWTYSRLSAFETCAKQFYHTKVIKDVVEGETEATIWGTKVHTAFENNMLHGTPLPEGMKHWDSIAAKFANLPGTKLVEHKYAVDKIIKQTQASLYLFDAYSAARQLRTKQRIQQNYV